MTFTESISVCFKKYVTFEGRAGRPEFWWFFLFSFLVQLVVNYVSGILGMLVTLALILPGLAVGARRLHDIGKTGWLMLVGLIPLIGWIVLIYLYAQPGMAESNAYGAPPAAAPADGAA